MKSAIKTTLAVVAFFLVTVGLNTKAEAQFFQGFEAQVGIEYPMSIQVRGKANLPQNWFTTIGVGLSPEFLTDSYASLASNLGIHGDNTSKLAAAGMSNNIYLDLRGGYEFSSTENNSFYVDFGYSLSVGKGGQTDMDTIEQALDRDFFGVNQTSKPDISTSLHCLTVHAGYTKRLSNSFFLVLEAGLIKPINSTTEVSFDSFITPTSADEVDREVNSYLEGVYTGEMFVPTFSAWASYLF